MIRLEYVWQAKDAGAARRRGGILCRQSMVPAVVAMRIIHVDGRRVFIITISSRPLWLCFRAFEKRCKS